MLRTSATSSSTAAVQACGADMPHKSPTDQLPEGFSYQPDFLAESEEIELLRRFADLPFAPFEFQGYLAKRRIIQYGREYSFRTRRATAAAPLPDFLANLRDRAARFADLMPEQLVEAVITEYPPGAPIGEIRIEEPDE